MQIKRCVAMDLPSNLLYLGLIGVAFKRKITRSISFIGWREKIAQKGARVFFSKKRGARVDENSVMDHVVTCIWWKFGSHPDIPWFGNATT